MPSAQFQLVEYVVKVDLDGPHADREATCNRFVVEPQVDQAHDFELSRSQHTFELGFNLQALAETLRQIDAVYRQPLATVVYGPKAALEESGRHRFEYDPTRAKAYGVEQDVFVLHGREHHDSRGLGSIEAPQQAEPVRIGQLQVEEKDVWLVRRDGLPSFGSGAARREYLELRFETKQLFKTAQYERMIVHHDKSNRHR